MQGSEIDPEKIAAAFGEVLRRYRLQKALSQERLAEICDLDRTYISMLERGINQPSLATLIRLAHALDIPSGQLVAEVEGAIRTR